MIRHEKVANPYFLFHTSQSATVAAVLGHWLGRKDTEPIAEARSEGWTSAGLSRLAVVQQGVHTTYLYMKEVV